MSISYHGVVGYGSGRTSLPSVETWGSNMNILRDPPKSIFTRKIDKVSDTSEITQMIQDSGDRACEAINVYARGVNPMVAVSYDNYGNNGGQKSGNLSQQGMNLGGNRQAYLPYRIMDRGAFRPPIKDQRDLLPLSRLPRVWTSSFTQPGFADFSKKAMCPANTGEDYRGAKKAEQMLKACIRPTATYKINTPVVEGFEVKYVIKNPVSVPAFSGVQPNARFNGEIGQPVKEIHELPLRPDANINLSQNRGVTTIDELYGVDTENRTKRIQTVDYETPHTGYEKNEYIHEEINLDRVLPYHEGRTNTGQNIHKRLDGQVTERSYVPNRPTAAITANVGRDVHSVDTISSRQYNLRPTISAGTMESVPTIPTTYRENNLEGFDLQKSRTRQAVYEMQQDRNISLGNLPMNMITA